MSKRLTDTDIWEQDWYIDLSNEYKLVWNYIKDKCDNAGIWRPNKSLLQKIIGKSINFDDFLMFVNTDGKERIKVLPSGRWFLKDFFIFQYGDQFNPKSPVHKGALKALLSNGVHISELPNLEVGKLKDVDIQSLREIGYQKGNATLSIAYEYGSNRDIYKDISTTINIVNNNTMISKKEISFSVQGIGEMSVFIFDNSNEKWRSDQLEKFLCQSESMFVTMASTRPVISSKDCFQRVVQAYVYFFQEGGEAKEANEIRKHFRNWVNAQNGKLDKIAKGTFAIPTASIEELEKNRIDHDEYMKG